MTDAFSAKFAFAPERRYCLGAEEEVWTVNRKGLLVPAAPLVFTPGYEERLPGFKPELPSQQIEAVTPVCASLAELETALKKNDATLKALGKEHGFTVCRDPVPVKPFAIHVFPKERYLRIQERFGERLRGAYVAGLHVHVGLGSGEEAVAAMNYVRVHLPAFLAISARSPATVDGTRYRSYRYVRYREMAGTTAPPSLKDWAHFGRVAEENGFAEDPRMCWWALRISPHGTIELRVCDIQSDVRRTLGLAALFRMMVRIGVEGLQPAEPASPVLIEERLMLAAQGRINVARYLNRAVRLAEFPIFKEERPFVKRLLG